ncbi:esterase-like activity of phytase family protein [bacterium]|nr:esterase-like activity of phytase family protein [bacterium]
MHSFRISPALVLAFLVSALLSPVLAQPTTPTLNLMQMWKASAGDSFLPLELVEALPVEGPTERIDTSGLTLRDGVLYTVSDKHDETIFRVERQDGKAVLVPEVRFKVPPGTEQRRLDLEGIDVGPDGAFYVVSETNLRILRVGRETSPARWVTPSLRPYGEKVGLFQTPGAFLEGVACQGPGRFVVCAERQPRGLLFVDTTVEPMKVEPYNAAISSLGLARNPMPDFTGLWVEGDRMYALLRSINAVCRLEREGDRFVEKDVWSFDHIVRATELRYALMLYGRGEGLCLDENFVYVILDNNHNPQLRDPEDRRPLLLVMRRPEEEARSE